MDLAFPINKNLWTSSFSVFMAGISSSAFAFCYWLVDVKGWCRWAQPFAIYGMNAIAVYVLAECSPPCWAAPGLPEPVGRASQ